MKKINFLLLIICGFFPVFVNGLTVPSYTCPQTYHTVRVGDGMDAIRTACGEPTSVAVREVPLNSSTDTTQWIYTTLLKVDNNLVSVPALVITFRNKQVIKIEKSSMGTPSGYCANPGVLNINDTEESVLSACGRPNVVNSKQEANPTATKQITQWIYNLGPYKPQLIFEFDGNAVSQIISGS